MPIDQNEFLELLRDEAKAVMAFGGIPPRTAEDLAHSLCERIMLRAGGDSPYIPSGCSLRRQKALAELDRGAEPKAVARKFLVSRRTLQRWQQQDAG